MPNSCKLPSCQKVKSSKYYFISDAPKVETPEEIIGAEIGRPVHIKCKASAYPEALVYWRHGSKSSNTKNLIIFKTY